MFHFVEAWITARLLASPFFHRAVRTAHKKVHEIRRGEKLHDITEGSRTNIDVPNTDGQKFLKHFMEELKDQLRGTTKR